MSTSQTKPAKPLSAGQLFCPQCNAALPPGATFCGSCGERLGKQESTALFDEQDITDRYRITTLVRRRPSINLYFAIDNRQELTDGQPRMVAIRDIEVGDQTSEERELIAALAQKEYDNLRRWQIPHTLACIDQRSFQGHLFLISGLPLPAQKAEKNVSAQRLYTLQDFLQSGQGLPKEARSLEWIRPICRAVSELHRREIIIGDLDPYTIALDKNSLEAVPWVMISWILPALQKLLPESPTTAPQISYFSAPEALAGKPEVRSDVYSIGALLYLLLTGTPPGESTLRNRHGLRSPHEINSRISQHVDEAVMQALAIAPEDRFASVAALLAALNYTGRQLPRKIPEPATQTKAATQMEAETVRIIPLSQKEVLRWRSAEQEKQRREKVAEQATIHVPVVDYPPVITQTPPGKEYAEQTRSALDKLPTTPPLEKSPAPTMLPRETTGNQHTPPFTPAAPRPSWRKRLTGILSATKSEATTAPKARTRAKRPSIAQAQAIPEIASNLPDQDAKTAPSTKNASESSFLKQIQNLILGQQQHAVDAAAIIETPVRVRPEQPYSLRLHIMGRDEPSLRPKAAKKGERAAGLSAMVHGDIVQIEVRSILQQGYTYVLQKANVTIPANRYEAEVTIPMQPQTGGASGRRDRLHVFFMDEHRHPLYEKPFVIEVFISPLVQFGREGHQVLTIPL